MTREELQTIQEYRLENETINQARERLYHEGKLAIDQPQEEDDAYSATINVNFADDIVIPRLKLIQPTCHLQSATPGTFRNSLTFEETEILEDVIFLKQHNTRSLFAENDFSGERKCWSTNGYVPAREQILNKTGREPQASVCATKEDGKVKHLCPFAVWRNQLGEPDENGNKPPLCKASISFLGINSGYMPFFVIFHGAALPLVKDFLRYIQYKCEEGRRLGKNLQIYDFKITVGLELETTNKGKYFVPVFLKKEEIADKAQREIIAKCYDSLQGRFLVE